MKILVIEALGLHLGYLGCYGNDWVATPNLDRLAVQGVVFDWHIADRPELGSITLWGQRFGCPGETKPRVVQCTSLRGFADRLLQETAAHDPWLWIEGPSLLPPWTLEDDLLDGYFDEDDVEEGLTPWRDPPLDVVTLDDAQVVQLQNTYAAVVTFFDAQLGKLLEHWPDRDDYLVCVTARSGLPLGEHGMIGVPQPALHDELVHVPLVMRLPRQEHAGLRVAALTQPVDLVPTCLEALGQSTQAMAGHSLWPVLRGESAEVRPFAVSTLRVAGGEARLLRTLDRALHLDPAGADGIVPSPRLFVKPEDRWEVNDVYHHEVEAADSLEQALRDAAGGSRPLHAD